MVLYYLLEHLFWGSQSSNWQFLMAQTFLAEELSIFRQNVCLENEDAESWICTSWMFASLGYSENVIVNFFLSVEFKQYILKNKISVIQHYRNVAAISGVKRYYGLHWLCYVTFLEYCKYVSFQMSTILWTKEVWQRLHPATKVHWWHVRPHAHGKGNASTKCK